MFARLAEQYRSVVDDLVLSLRALADGLQSQGFAATCYVCGDDRDGHGASFVAGLGDGHLVRFLVSDYGISWVESRNGHELVKLEGADAIQELERVAEALRRQARSPEPAAVAPEAAAARAVRAKPRA
ncbi:MAG: hypothetical protein RLZZ219_1056 [Cyanobacteriota bacterium]